MRNVTFRRRMLSTGEKSDTRTTLRGGINAKIAFHRLIPTALVLAFVSAACGTAATAPAETQVPAAIPATATVTPQPTATARPTATPNLAATQTAKETADRIQGYVDNGYLPDTKGKLSPLMDFNKEVAKKNYLSFDLAGPEDAIADFAAWGDMKWSSAAPVSCPEYSGCGFGFRVRDNGDAYNAMLTNDRVLITDCSAAPGRRCGEVGKTRGPGKVKFGNPAEAHFELIVNQKSAYVLVNHEFVGEYSLFQDKLTDPGYFLYSMISGTNKDYGTGCEITHGGLWIPGT